MYCTPTLMPYLDAAGIIGINENDKFKCSRLLHHKKIVNATTYFPPLKSKLRFVEIGAQKIQQI